jgi:hypothetical protein
LKKCANKAQAPEGWLVCRGQLRAVACSAKVPTPCYIQSLCSQNSVLWRSLIKQLMFPALQSKQTLHAFHCHHAVLAGHSCHQNSTVTESPARQLKV